MPQMDTGKIYTNQTGNMTRLSSLDNQYIFVCYVYDLNLIYGIPIKRREKGEILKAYTIIIDKLRQCGYQPTAHWLDNEASGLIKDINKVNNIMFRLIEPYVHRKNATERAIRTYKNHLNAALCCLPPNFLLNLWDRQIPQANKTINLLRASYINPKISAYTALEAAFDLNKTQLAPPGCPVLIHEASTQRKSWDLQAVDTAVLQVWLVDNKIKWLK